MVGLNARRQPPAQAERIAKFRDDAPLCGDQDQVLVAADLRDRCGHFGRHPEGQGCERVLIDGVGEKPVAKFADGQRGDRRKGVSVVAVEDQSRDLVLFVGDKRFVQKHAQGQIGEGHLRSDALRGARRRNAGEAVAGTQWGRLRHQHFKVWEPVARSTYRRCIHGQTSKDLLTGYGAPADMSLSARKVFPRPFVAHGLCAPAAYISLVRVCFIAPPEPMSAHTADPETLIRALPLWRGPIEIAPLLGGITNKNYIVKGWRSIRRRSPWRRHSRSWRHAL